MTCWAIIPVKAGTDSKSRLAGVLDEDARTALVDAMLARVVEAARDARNVARVCILGTPRGLPIGDLTVLADPGGGLNAAVTSALAGLDAKVTRAIFIHADLPHVTARDLELLAAAPEGEVAIAPDRHGLGTNALSLPLPEARNFAFAFGIDSCARHHAEAERLGLKLEVIHSQGLAADVDEPADLKDAAGLRGS